MGVDWKAPLQSKEKPATQENLSLVVTFNEILPNVKNVIDKHWHNLSNNEKFWKAFDKKRFIAYRRNNNLHQIFGGNHILKTKVVRKNDENDKQSGKCAPCVSLLNNPYSK